ncbi:helix-turn-helix domain-containing protein [Tetragenococcus solitarius]|uniref:HTH cro/C1-type domain-containing protein n=1 Tax=Tetragenococcus solitarius TaxID=71453 RepID=A0ABN3Y085_9ENTE|nr:helix-turn-helix transcriptional regulator [Tetragenococcus solitarius]
MKAGYQPKKIVLHVDKLAKENYDSLRDMAIDTDIQISSLSRLARNERQRVDLGHLKRIAEALDLHDMNEIISIENDDSYKDETN